METAEERYDENLLRRIRGQVQFACEAKYHKSCWMKYLQRPEKRRNNNTEERKKQADMMEAHREAFKNVC